MIPGRLLTDSVTLQVTEDGAPDRYGDATVQVQTSVAVAGRIEQQATAEDEGRQTTVNLWRLYVNDPGVELAPKDRVLYDGRTFEIVGSPTKLNTPRGLHHIEADLQEVVE